MGPPAKKIHTKDKISRLKTNRSQRKGVDHKSSQPIEDVLSIPLILRIVLENFWDLELLQLSLVSKLWCHEARTLLRHRGFLTARIKSNHPCQDLKAFASDLRQMSVVPFSGIKINLGSRCDCDEGCVASEAAGLDPSYDVIRARLDLKKLHVAFNYFQPRCRNCPAFYFVHKIMADFDGALERLSLKIEDGRGVFVQEFLQGRRFSRLKTLRLYDKFCTERKDCTDLIKALASRSPKLETFYVHERVDLTENLLKGSSACIVADYEVCPTLDDISQSLYHAFQMTQVQLWVMRNDLSLDRNMVLPLLLQLSRTTLRSVDMYAAFLVPLMGYGICLQNVTQFKMHFSGLEPYRPEILSLIKSFDFTLIFPSVTEVEIFGDAYPNPVLQSQIVSFIEQWNASFRNPPLGRAINPNIKELFLHLPHDRCPEFLPEMFPHVERLNVSVSQGQIIPRLILEGHWKGLKELEVEKVESNTFRNANIDSILCGIFPEEIARLKRRSDKYLKAVNLVPVMPSIVGLKGLKDVSFSGASYVPDPPGSCPCVSSLMFSKVASGIVSKSCPGLVVGLVGEDYKNSLKICTCRLWLNKSWGLKSSRRH